MTVFGLSHINFIASPGENCIVLGSFVTCVTPVPGSRSPRGGYGMTESTPFVPLRTGNLCCLALVAPSWAAGAWFVLGKVDSLAPRLGVLIAKEVT